MPNITLSVEEDLIRKAREYARKHRISLNALIRGLLRKQVDSSSEWLNDCFKLMDETEANSQGETWRREDLYER